MDHEWNVRTTQVLLEDSEYSGATAKPKPAGVSSLTTTQLILSSSLSLPPALACACAVGVCGL